MLIMRPFGIESITRQVFNQFAIRFEHLAIRTAPVRALGVISQGFMADSASNRVTNLVRHQKANAVLF